jgi:hypothetical protein
MYHQRDDDTYKGRQHLGPEVLAERRVLSKELSSKRANDLGHPRSPDGRRPPGSPLSSSSTSA